MRAVDSVIIHNLYRNLVYKDGDKKQIISNRIADLVKRGILIKDDGFTISYDPYGRKIYRLSSRAYTALSEAELITPETLAAAQKAAYYYANRNIKSSNHGLITLHSYTLTRLVSFIVDAWHKENPEVPLNYLRGTQSLELYSVKVDDAALIPDYIFINKSRVVFLENDTGTQSSTVIYDKLERYKELILKINSKNPDKALEFSVIFSVVDNSLNPKLSINAASRVGTLKTINYRSSEWPENMRVFIEQAEKAVSLTLNTLNGVDITESIEKARMVDDMFSLLQMHLGNEDNYFSVKEIDYMDFLNLSTLYWDSPPRLLRIKGLSREVIMMVTFIEPGDLRDYHKALQCDRNLKTALRENLNFAHSVLICNVYLYRYQDQLVNDHIRVESGIETRLLSLENLIDWENNASFKWHSMKNARQKRLEVGILL